MASTRSNVSRSTAAAPAGRAPGATRRSRRTQAQYQVYEAVLRAASAMERGFAELFKPYDLSTSQFNVLRILRGAGEPGLACGQIAERLLHSDPDVTRLIDRLERRTLVSRVRDTSDRRIVRTMITPAGLDLLEELETPTDEEHERQLSHLSEKDLLDLAARVDAARLARR